MGLEFLRLQLPTVGLKVMRRCLHSNINDVMTELGLDYEVLSKYCHACSFAEKKDMTPVERDEWKWDHEPYCQKNYDGSSKGMEKEATLPIWGRSVEKNNMHYVCVLCLCMCVTVVNQWTGPLDLLGN